LREIARWEARFNQGNSGHSATTRRQYTTSRRSAGHLPLPPPLETPHGAEQWTNAEIWCIEPSPNLAGRRPAAGNQIPRPAEGIQDLLREPVMFMKNKPISHNFGNFNGRLRDQALEIKTVILVDYSLEKGRETRWQNAGITCDVTQNKRDTKLTGVKSVSNLRCSSKLYHLALPTCDITERKGESCWRELRMRDGGVCGCKTVLSDDWGIGSSGYLIIGSFKGCTSHALPCPSQAMIEERRVKATDPWRRPAFQRPDDQMAK